MADEKHLLMENIGHMAAFQLKYCRFRIISSCYSFYYLEVNHGANSLNPGSRSGANWEPAPEGNDHCLPMNWKKQKSTMRRHSKSLAPRSMRYFQLKLTIRTLRDELEKTQINHQENIQKSMVSANDENNSRLKSRLNALRTKLEHLR